MLRVTRSVLTVAMHADLRRIRPRHSFQMRESTHQPICLSRRSRSRIRMRVQLFDRSVAPVPHHKSEELSEIARGSWSLRFAWGSIELLKRGDSSVIKVAVEPLLRRGFSYVSPLCPCSVEQLPVFPPANKRRPCERRGASFSKKGNDGKRAYCIGLIQDSCRPAR